MSLGEILDELQSELTDRKGLFGKKVDLDRCADLVYELRETLPESLREAEYIVANRKKIFDNADIVAKNTIKEAEERAAHIVENSELIKRAEAEGDKLIDAAQAQCDNLTDRTKTHLDNMFKDIEQFLLSTLAMIRNNREELRGALLGTRNKK